MNADIERFAKCYYVQITLPPQSNWIIDLNQESALRRTEK